MKKRNVRIYAASLILLLSITVGSTLTTGMIPGGKEAVYQYSAPDISQPLQLQPHPYTIPPRTAGQMKNPNHAYIVTDLAEATDPLGVAQCEAVGINNNGEVVGYEVLDDFKYRSIYWSQNGTATILENNEDDNSSRPYMIDDNGLILGWSAFVWYEFVGDIKLLHMNQTAVTWKNKVISDLNDDATSGDVLDLYHARDNNDAGTIVGSGAPPGNIPPPWWPNGFTFDDGNVTDLGAYTYPNAINNQGHLAGYIEGGFTHAYEWEDGTLIDLNIDPIIKANYSQAFDINDNDVIVGFAQYDYSLLWEPTVWKDHEAIRILPTDSQYCGYAWAVNEHDEVVGSYDDLNTGIPYAFLWKDGQLLNLYDYLPANQSWENIYPEDINDHGQIVGLGYRTDIGWRAFLMTPATPNFDIDIKGGKGITATIHNTGNAPATNVSWNIVIDGGFIFSEKITTGSNETIAVGENLTIQSAPKGIGLGLLFPIPKIQINITCAEGVTATKTVPAKIFLSRIIIQ